MKLINQGHGLWGVEHEGRLVVDSESYQVACNVAEGNGTGETEEVRDSILRGGSMRITREVGHTSHKVWLTCAVCGESAGIWQQHWNRDAGFGVCVKCVCWLLGSGRESQDTIENLYGINGVNWGGQS